MPQKIQHFQIVGGCPAVITIIDVPAAAVGRPTGDCRGRWAVAAENSKFLEILGKMASG